MYPTERLSEVVAALAGETAEPALRAQLHALSGIVCNLDAEPPDAERTAALRRRLDEGMQNGDEPAVLGAMRELAALQREPLRWVDWSAASGG